MHFYKHIFFLDVKFTQQNLDIKGTVFHESIFMFMKYP